MDMKKLAIGLLVILVSMAHGYAGDFKIQYPAGIDIFKVNKSGDLIVTGILDIGDDTIEEADLNFITNCGPGNHLYISGGNLACEPDNDEAYDPANIAFLNETDQEFTGTQIFDVIEAQDWTNVSITESQISDFGTYLTSQEGNDTYIISANMDDLAELNTQINGDLISSAQLNASYMNVIKGTMTNAKWCVYDSTTDTINCNVDPVTDTHQGYTNIAMLNESGVFTEPMSFTALIDKGNFTACGEGEIMKYTGGAWTCAAETGGGIQDYTNIAMTNQTNTFAKNQIFSGNITLSADSVINGSGSSDSYFRIDSGGNMIFVLGG